MTNEEWEDFIDVWSERFGYWLMVTCAVLFVLTVAAQVGIWVGRMVG